MYGSKKQVKALIDLHKIANQKDVIKTKSIQDIFIEMESNKDLKTKLWEVWHASHGAVPYQSNGYISARMSYTAKFMNQYFPEFSKAAFYKYLDRNIN